MSKTRWPLKLSLRVRLVAWYSLLAGLTMLLFDAYLYFQFRRSLLAQVDRTLEIVAIQALKNIDSRAPTLAFRAPQDAQALAELLGEAGVSVHLFTRDGTLRGHFGKPLPTVDRADLSAGFQTWREGRESRRVYTSFLPARDGRPGGWLLATHSLRTVDRTSNYVLRQIVIGGPIFLGMVALGGLFLANRALNPIEQITSMASQIRESGDLTRRLHYQGTADELKHLATMFDKMLDTLQKTFENERRFISDASHELRTPLTTIKGRITVTLNRPRSQSQYVEALQILEQEVDRLIRLSSDLLLLSQLEQHHSTSDPEVIDLSALLGEIAEQIQPLAELKQLALVRDIPPDLQVPGSPDRLIRLFLNLLDNAVKYTPPRGRIDLTARVEENTIDVRVANAGNGIAAEHLPHIFQRFYRTEASRSRQIGGTGLGLAIAQEIAHHHRGQIRVWSQPNQGTTFAVTLPRQK